ncbi:MAG: PEP-CTERM sorting domain-containing protein [bacterium]|nr:PEP-CTERM sorting domain-containing protein [bacterium]
MKFRTTLILFCLSVATPCLAGDPFTIVLLPDTQDYTDSDSWIGHFQNQTQWIVDNRDTMNIAFVSHLGDIVQNLDNTTESDLAAEWARADGAMDTLDTLPDLPYGVVLGNHDTDPVYDANGSAANYVANFGSARYDGKTWYGGADADQRNHYQTFSAGGHQFLNLSLEYQACSTTNSDYADVIAWAQGVIDAHPDSPTIISTHDYLTTGGRSSQGNDIFNALVSDNQQVFMVVNGHSPGENHRTVQNDSGDDVFEVLADYQGRLEGGTGWLRILEFDEDNGLINNITYSPSLGEYEEDAGSQFSFSMNFDDRLDVVTVTPEPASLSLLALGGLALLRRRQL